MQPKTIFAEINLLHSENITNAQRTAENAVVIGVKFHQLKEILPHGEFEQTAQKSCAISDVTRQRYMLLAKARLVEQRAIKLLTDNAHDRKSFTVKLLDDPDQQAIPMEIQSQARDQIESEDYKWTDLDIKPKELARGIEGKELSDLYRLYGVIREKKPKQFVAPKPLTPDELIASQNEQAEALLTIAENALATIGMDLTGAAGILALRIAPKRWKEFLRSAVTVTKLARPLSKRKQSPADQQQSAIAARHAKVAAKAAQAHKSPASPKSHPVKL